MVFKKGKCMKKINCKSIILMTLAILLLILKLVFFEREVLSIILSSAYLGFFLITGINYLRKKETKVEKYYLKIILLLLVLTRPARHRRSQYEGIRRHPQRRHRPLRPAQSCLHSGVNRAAGLPRRARPARFPGPRPNTSFKDRSRPRNEGGFFHIKTKSPSL